MAKTHELKTWPAFYEAVINGQKPFEHRLNDRGFAAGDTLLLKEYDPDKQTYSGRELAVTVLSIWNSDQVPGLSAGYVLMSISPPKRTVLVGVGMPAYEYLQEFGNLLYSVFENTPYLVGSAFKGKDWRDIDVRLMLEDDQWQAWGMGRPDSPNRKWRGLVMAFSELGRKMTGLPIDFQLQHRIVANERYKGPRNPLGCEEISK